MAFSPRLFEGNLLYFWAMQQFTAEVSRLVAIEIDLDNVAQSGTKATPASILSGSPDCFDHVSPEVTRDADGGSAGQGGLPLASGQSLNENTAVPAYVFLDFHWCLRIIIPDPVGDPCPVIVCPEFAPGFPHVSSYCDGDYPDGTPNCQYCVGGSCYRQLPGPGWPLNFEKLPLPAGADNTGFLSDGCYFLNDSSPGAGPGIQGVGGIPVFGFRRVLRVRAQSFPRSYRGKV